MATKYTDVKVIHIWHAHSTIDTLSSDTRVNYLLTFTVTHVLK